MNTKRRRSKYSAKMYHKLIAQQAVKRGIIIIVTQEKEKECPGYPECRYHKPWNPHIWCNVHKRALRMAGNSTITLHLENNYHFRHTQSVLVLRIYIYIPCH